MNELDHRISALLKQHARKTWILNGNENPDLVFSWFFILIHISNACTFLYNPHQNQYQSEWILFHNQESSNYKLTSWMPVFLLKQHPLEVSISTPSFIFCSPKKLSSIMNQNPSAFNRKGTPYGRNLWTSSWYLHFKQLTTEVSRW